MVAKDTTNEINTARKKIDAQVAAEVSRKMKQLAPYVAELNRYVRTGRQLKALLDEYDVLYNPETGTVRPNVHIIDPNDVADFVAASTVVKKQLLPAYERNVTARKNIVTQIKNIAGVP
jgi:hypothetical protein